HTTALHRQSSCPPFAAMLILSLQPVSTPKMSFPIECQYVTFNSAIRAWRRFRWKFIGLRETMEELREDALWLKERQKT
ncbi:MAG: hypothetical protein L6306_16550, partial [Planctomycetales bacterium]|nr:hypothetical protein [Planctomycetales bacterium]